MASSIKNILLPTDFSTNAEIALHFAAEIALQANAKITLFHARQPNLSTTVKDDLGTKSSVSAQFDQLLTTVRNHDKFKTLNLSTAKAEGRVIPLIQQHADEQNVDLIVMGTKGVTGNRKAIWGSVTTKVIQKSSTPVLVVPPIGNMRDIKNITFSTSYKNGDITALQNTVDFAQLFDLPVTILHVSSQKNLKSAISFRGFKEIIQEQIAYNRISFRHEYDLDYFPAMSNIIDENPHTMLVVTRKQKTIGEKLFNRDHTKEMAFYSQVPLLVFNTPQSEFTHSIFDQ